MGVWEIMDKGDLIMIVSVLTLACAVWAVYVAREIAFMQQWNSLVTEYRSKEFGESVKAISDFWVDDCKQEVERVEPAYTRIVNRDNRKVAMNKKNVKETLRFHRRTLLHFYWHLNNCIDGKFRSKKKVLKKYFNRNEINLIAIVYKIAEVDEKFFEKLTPPSIDTEDKQKDNSWRKPLKELHTGFQKIFPKNNQCIDQGTVTKRQRTEKDGEPLIK